MGKIRMAITIAIFIAHFESMGQCIENKKMEHILYTSIIKRFISFNNYQQLNNRKFSSEEYLSKEKLYVLDTGEFFTISFRCLSLDSTFWGYNLIEFNVNTSTIVKENYKKLPLIKLTEFPQSMTISRGLIGLDKNKFQFFVLSGNLFLDDIKKEYFSNNITPENMRDYVYYRYYNYSPSIYKTTKKYVYFKSEYNIFEDDKLITYKKKYKVKIWKSRSGVHEQFKEVESSIIDKG